MFRDGHFSSLYALTHIPHTGNMPIMQHHIDELKVLYQKQSGEKLSDKEAWDMAIRMVNLFRVLLKAKIEPDEPKEVRTL